MILREAAGERILSVFDAHAVSDEHQNPDWPSRRAIVRIRVRVSGPVRRAPQLECLVFPSAAFRAVTHNQVQVPKTCDSSHRRPTGRAAAPMAGGHGGSWHRRDWRFKDFDR